MDASGAADEGAWLADGKAVWSRHPDAGVKLATMLTHRAGDGGKKARFTRESAEETVKTNRAGNAGCFRRPAVTNLRAFCFAREAAGAHGAPGIPCALRVKGQELTRNFARIFAARARSCVCGRQGCLTGEHQQRCVERRLPPIPPRQAAREWALHGRWPEAPAPFSSQRRQAISRSAPPAPAPPCDRGAHPSPLR